MYEHVINSLSDMNKKYVFNSEKKGESEVHRLIFLINFSGEEF